jgi:hypothetical protein
MLNSKNGNNLIMAYGYNELIWILSVIVWVTGMIAIIFYIKKRKMKSRQN